MKSMFKLYYAPGTCALATHIALEEAGADYEAERVDFGSQAQRSPDYLAINPKGRVPALVTEQGTLTETPSLLLFVAQRFPAAELAPLADPFALSVLDRTRGACARPARPALGRRPRGYRGHETQSTPDDDGMLRADRKQADQGPMGHG
jgi:glutathione S-transferase